MYAHANRHMIACMHKRITTNGKDKHKATLDTHETQTGNTNTHTCAHTLTHTYTRHTHTDRDTH